MKKDFLFLILFTLFGSSGYGQNGDTIIFKGQLSAWFNYSSTNDEFLLGGRYIPQLNVSKELKNSRLLDAEVAANLYGTLPGDPDPQGDIKPYRAWVRYSTSQFEIRAGLQKINFGSATMLRPLMWFDQMDPRDPLQLTDGVWGLLGRYYFLNNANIWLWGLYGNDEAKGWEFFGTKKKTPEFGGRFQYPIPLGEAALSYHHRVAFYYGFTEMREMNFPENRFGFDAKIDWFVGLWVEASWKNFSKDYGLLTNQTLLNCGADYTFGLGNGLLVTYEHLVAAQDSVPFRFDYKTNFSLMSLSYPIGLFDNVSAIFYYSWDNEQIYSFLNWQRTFNRISLHLMAYWNPEFVTINFHNMQNFQNNFYGGKGVQFMFVFNH